MAAAMSSKNRYRSAGITVPVRAAVQRRLYSAFLASTLSVDQVIPSRAQSVILWESAEARLQAAHARVLQRANEGQSLPRSMGVPRAGARWPQKLGEPHPRASLPAHAGQVGSVERPPEPPVL